MRRRDPQRQSAVLEEYTVQLERNEDSFNCHGWQQVEQLQLPLMYNGQRIVWMRYIS